MAFCPNCGAPATASFCRQCGTATPSASQPGVVSAGGELPENAAAALAYLFLFVSGIVMLVWAPYSRNKVVRFHAVQSILFTVAWLVVNFIVAIVVPLSLMAPVGEAVHLAFLLIWLWAMWKAYNNERLILPVIGPVVEKQA